MFGLREEEINRYSRQLILDAIGGRGQQKIGAAHVLIVGAGGLGSPAAMYLAAAGIGTLGIVDYDQVEVSNLQRQILHFTGDIGRPKVESARETLEALNPGVTVREHKTRLGVGNVRELIQDYDLIVDGVDNFAARYLVNDACVMSGKPLIEAGILRFQGQVMTILPGRGPCYRCVFQDPPAPGTVPSCQEAGVLGMIAGTIGTLQATEAIKYITGAGTLLSGRLLVYDALQLSFREVAVDRNPDCRMCGENPSITELEEYALECDLQATSDG